MKKINAAIVGSGYGFYVIYKALKRLKNIKVIAVCARDQKKLNNIFKDKNIVFFRSWKKMLLKKDIDFLAIATIPDIQTKLLLSKEIKKNKIKYFFVEKPLAENLKNAKKIFDLYKYKKKFLVDFTFLETDVFIKFQELIRKNIENINFINVTWKFRSHYNKYKYKTWKKNAKYGGGIIKFYLIHLLDYLNFFIGNFRIIKFRYNNKDSINFEANFNKSKKIVVNFDSNFSRQPIHKIQIIGKNLELLLENNSNQYFQNFKIRVKKRGKIKCYVQKKNRLIKDEDDYRIFPVFNYLKKLIKNERINNLKQSLKASEKAEFLIKNRVH